MDMDEVILEEEEIDDIVAGLKKSPTFDVDQYDRLLNMKCTSVRDKKFLIKSVVKICEQKSEAVVQSNRVSETLNFMLSFINDEKAAKVRPLVCDSFPSLCVFAKEISKIVETLAVILGNGYEESSMAKRSLRKIMGTHIEAFSVFPQIIERFSKTDEFGNVDTKEAIDGTRKGKLILLQILDEELQKYGTAGDKLKKFVQDVYKKLLEEIEQNDLNAIEDVLKAMLQTSFFSSRDEKRDVLDGLYTNKSLDCYVLFQDLLGGQRTSEEVERAAGFAVAISKWIEGVNIAAWNTLCDFIGIAKHILLEELSTVLLEKMTFFTQRKSGTLSFKFIEQSNYEAIDGQIYADYFAAVKDALKFLSSNKKTDETVLDKLEKLLLVAYDILPLAKHREQFTAERNRWEPQAKKILQRLRTETESLKTELNKKFCEKKDAKQSQLKRRLNIGVLLFALLSKEPSQRSHHIVPSWLPAWKPPKAANEPSPTSAQSRKRKNNGVIQPPITSKRARFPTIRSRRRASR